MKFKVGDKVRVHKRCEHYKAYMPEILNHVGIVVDINETYDNPIIVSIEGVSNKYSKKGYFYFGEDDLIYCGGRNGIFDNFDIIGFNKLLQDITDRHGLISSYRWSDNLNGYLYDFYRDHFTDKNRVARVLVKPNQLDDIDDIYETLSVIDEHLVERLNPMPYQIKHLGRWNLGQEENQYIKRDIKFAKALESLVINEKENNMLKGKKVGIMIIEKVIFNDPATIVFWKDGTKTVVKASNEKFDPEKGLAMAIAKKALGNEGNYFNEIKKWLPEDKSIYDNDNFVGWTKKHCREIAYK